MAEPIKTQTPINQQDSSLVLSNFQIKAIFIAMFIVFLPILSSQAPDFVKQVLSNKMWELFHLLLVGVAVSYGLFSRKGNDQETEKGNADEPDNPRSFVSDMLDGLPVFDSNESDNTNVQSWSSMHNPNEPLVVVENEIMDGNAQKINKPLLLPIRSLNQLARDVPKFHGQDESFQNNGDADAYDSTNEEEKGDILQPSYNSNSGRSKNEPFRSLNKKQSNDGQKITPENFKCEQNNTSSIGRSIETVRLNSSNSMDELIKTLESESDESFDEEESSNSSSCVTDDGTEENEVDKKADEFIAKFREQIRQQRMQCRRRPTGRKGGAK